MELAISNTYNVKMFGAVGDGVHDDTTAVQAAYQGLVANGGGTLYFPPGIYAISSTLTIGNGNTTASTTSNIAVLGAGAGSAVALKFGGQNPPQVLASPNTSRIKWIGTAGANNTVVKIAGPIDTFSMANIEIEGNNAAGVGLSLSSLSGSKLDNVLVRNCTQAHYFLYGNGTLLGTCQNVFTNCGFVTTLNCGATIGIVLGGLGSDMTNLTSAQAQPPFLTTWIGVSGWVANSSGAVALDMRYTDNDVFVGGTLAGDIAAIQVSQNPNFTTFPAAVSFLGMNIAANTPATTFRHRGTFVMAPGLFPSLVWPFGDNGEPVPNSATDPWIAGMTVIGQMFGPTMNTGASLLLTARGGVGTVANTTTETAFGGLPYSLPANSILDNTLGSQNGAVLRIRASGNYSTTGSPTLRLRFYLAGVLVADTGPATTVTNAAGQAWLVEADVMANSAATVLQMAPKFAIGPNVQVGVSMQSAVGLSAGGALTVTAQWGTASPSNTATYYAVTVELLKSLAFL